MTDDAARGWADIVGPIKARFTIAAMAGMQTVHNAVGAQAVADIIGEMAAKLDAAIEREDAHTAALAAAGAAGEARGIERAAVVHDDAAEDLDRLLGIGSPRAHTHRVWAINIRALSPSASPALDAVIERARAEGFMLAHDTALAALAPSDGAIYAADFKAQLTAHHTLERVKAKLEEAAEGHAIRARGEKGDVAP